MIKSSSTNSIGTTDEEEGDAFESISVWYFRAAMITWFSTPVLVMPFALTHRAFSSDEFPMKWIAEKAYPPIFYLAKTLICFVASVAFVYIVIPIGDLLANTLKLCYGFDDKDHQLHVVRIHDMIRGSKLFEQFGEAIPQLALNFHLLYTNYNMIDSVDRIYSIVSMSLSLGSILTGIFLGSKYCNKCGWPGVYDNNIV